MMIMTKFKEHSQPLSSPRALPREGGYSSTCHRKARNVWPPPGRWWQSQHLSSLTSSSLRAGLFPSPIISSEVFSTVENCQEHATRQERRKGEPRSSHSPWLGLPENIWKVSLLSLKTVGKALSMPEKSVLEFEIDKGKAGLALLLSQEQHRLHCILLFPLGFL